MEEHDLSDFDDEVHYCKKCNLVSVEERVQALCVVANFGLNRSLRRVGLMSSGATGGTLIVS